MMGTKMEQTDRRTDGRANGQTQVTTITLRPKRPRVKNYCNDDIMSAMTSQITSLAIVYSTVYSRRRTEKTSKLRVTGLCEGNPPETDEFAAKRGSNTENVSIWWRRHVHGTSHRDENQPQSPKHSGISRISKGVVRCRTPTKTFFKAKPIKMRLYVPCF